jgi:hypothetical protein
MTVDPLSTRAQALLDAARDGLGPDDAAIARMRASVLAGAAGGVGVAAAGAAKTGLPLAAKLTILAVVAGTLGVGGWMLARGGDESRAGMTPSAAVVTETADPVSGTVSDPVSGTGTVSVSDPVRGVPPVALREAPQVPSRRAHAGNAAGSAAKPGRSLADEVALVDDAMAALRRDDARAALAAVDDHVARFGKRGQLAEEASAIRVESLCRLRDERWSSALDAFDAHWPRSAQRPRLTSACKGAR